jgi:adenylate kinase family enzyme
MKKIILIGISGSGKSTFGRALSEKLQLPITHLDSIFHLPGGAMMDHALFKEKQIELMKQPAWILDGNYGSSLDIRVAEADTIFWLDFPPLLSTLQVLKRSWKYRKDKSTQPDMPEYFEEHLFSREYWDFIKFILTFNKYERPKIAKALQRKKPETTLIVFKNRKEVHAFLSENSNTHD